LQDYKETLVLANLKNLSIDPSTGKAKRPIMVGHIKITDQDYLDHLNGRQSIGIQPCDDKGMAQIWCYRY
jgi:hypothetical protein